MNGWFILWLCQWFCISKEPFSSATAFTPWFVAKLSNRQCLQYWSSKPWTGHEHNSSFFIHPKIWISLLLEWLTLYLVATLRIQDTGFATCDLLALPSLFNADDANLDPFHCYMSPFNQASYEWWRDRNQSHIADWWLLHTSISEKLLRGFGCIMVWNDAICTRYVFISVFSSFSSTILIDSGFGVVLGIDSSSSSS